MTTRHAAVRVAWPEGVHARSARTFADAAAEYDASVTVARTDDPAATASAESLLELIALGVDHDDSVELTATGSDADAALEALVTLCTDPEAVST